MRRLVMIVCVIAGVSMGALPGQTETVAASGAAPTTPPPVPPPCTYGMRLRVVARIIQTKVQDSQLVVTITAGSNEGVASNWTGHVLRGESDVSLPGGEIQIVRVGKTLTIGKIHLTGDELLANLRVKLTAP
jgi:hypothetical protein